MSVSALPRASAVTALNRIGTTNRPLGGAPTPLIQGALPIVKGSTVSIVPPPATPRPEGKQCSVTDCLNASRSRGVCDAHYRRLLRHGDPLGSAPMGRPRAGDATYNAVHLRLKYDRGQAMTYPCADDCGRTAQSWAYDRGDPNQLYNSKGAPYSLEQRYYQPLCWPCHNARDRAARRSEAAS